MYVLLAAFVKALTRSFSVGKTRVESRDATCAVINAIMKMKIAVVAARIRQRGAREPQPGEDLLLGELQRRLPPPTPLRHRPPRPLCEARQCTFQGANTSETNTRSHSILHSPRPAFHPRHLLHAFSADGIIPPPFFSIFYFSFFLFYHRGVGLLPSLMILPK